MRIMELISLANGILARDGNIRVLFKDGDNYRDIVDGESENVTTEQYAIFDYYNIPELNIKKETILVLTSDPV